MSVTNGRETTSGKTVYAEDAAQLYRRYRPTRFEDVVGQDTAVSMLRNRLAEPPFPSFVLFGGPPGTGKTSLAEIVARELGCNTKMDWTELNCANQRGIDSAREVVRLFRRGPVGGDAQVILCDEAHMMTPECANLYLIPTERCPPCAAGPCK